MKYFKKTYHNGQVGAGLWKEGDAINYKSTSDYSVEDIIKDEYDTIKKNVLNQCREYEKKEDVIKLTSKIESGKIAGYDMKKEENDLKEIKLL